MGGIQDWEQEKYEVAQFTLPLTPYQDKRQSKPIRDEIYLRRIQCTVLHQPTALEGFQDRRIIRIR